jgi:TetR/AcrR family transcriptional regulator, transcriptional repressor for nem operon
MGHSQAEKAETHQRIVDLAATEEAGLAVGGFYKHFASRDDLVVEALTAAILEMDDSTLTKQRTLRKTIRTYLSETHRDSLQDSCPVSSLVNDISRSCDGAREVCTAWVERSFSDIADQIPTGTGRDRREKAIVIYSACVGAIALSRAVSDPDLSRKILKTVAKQLLITFCRSI